MILLLSVAGNSLLSILCAAGETVKLWQHECSESLTTVHFLQAVDGGKGGGEQILSVFEKRMTDNIEKLNFKQLLSPVNVKRVVEEADGYQPHLIAPEMGYRRLLMECLILFKVGAEPLDCSPFGED